MLGETGQGPQASVLTCVSPVNLFCLLNLFSMRSIHILFFILSNCLRSWLEQDTSCPTCRKSLQDDKEQQQQQASSSGAAEVNLGGNTQQQNQQQPQQPRGRFVQRNLFHFDGSRYISWLPSFSLQLTNGTGVLPSFIGNANRTPLDPQRLNEMVLKNFLFILIILSDCF
jgi:hypothetical protein